MSLSAPRPVVECSAGIEAIDHLCAHLGGAAPGTQGCTEVAPDEVPSTFHGLLVHNGHMTTVLEDHYGRPVALHVLSRREEPNDYSRKITLSPEGRQTVVEYGVVHLNLRHMPPAVAEEIRAARRPLGDILIRHNVHRRVEPRFFLRFDPGAEHLRWFDTQLPHTIYGRVGTIYCDGEPAIELLEIVTGVEPRDVK